MGYWNSTTYVRTSQMGVLRDCIEAMMRVEGYDTTTALRRHENLFDEVKRRRPHAPNFRVVGVTLHSTDAGWVVVKCNPQSLLESASKSASCLRVAFLSKCTGLELLHVSIEDDVALWGVECDSESNCALLGGSLQDAEATSEFIEQLDPTARASGVSDAAQSESTHVSTLRKWARLDAWSEPASKSLHEVDNDVSLMLTGQTAEFWSDRSYEAMRTTSQSVSNDDCCVLVCTKQSEVA